MRLRALQPNWREVERNSLDFRGFRCLLLQFLLRLSSRFALRVALPHKAALPRVHTADDDWLLQIWSGKLQKIHEFIFILFPLCSRILPLLRSLFALFASLLVQTALTRAPEAVLLVQLAPALLVAGVLVDVADEELVGFLELAVRAQVDADAPVFERVAAVRVARVVEEGGNLADAVDAVPDGEGAELE